MNTLSELGDLATAHNEIRKLKVALVKAQADLQQMTANYEMRDKELDAANEKISEMEEEGAAVDNDVRSAIDAFLDEVERPVGTRDFNVPKTPAVTRALIGLHDAINRNM